ncbi:MAG: serine/threonine-protein kinase [bacterium]
MTRDAMPHLMNLNEMAPAAGRRYAFQVGDEPLEGLTIKRPLGWGGYGDVYFAVTDAGKELAVKHVTHGVDVELRGVRHCINIRHPNLIEIYDIRKTADGSVFILMEYVAGRSLRSLLNDHPAGLSVSQVRAIAGGIISGVAGLHAHGIVHRDLKPANVFVGDGVVKIGDYGLSKVIGHAAMEHSTSVGTCHYMAPEIRSGRYEMPVDTYAIGAMLYEMITGKPPFGGETQAEVLMRHQFDLPRLEELPPSFRPVVGRLLDKDPGRRGSDLTEVNEWVESAVNAYEADARNGLVPGLGNKQRHDGWGRTLWRGLEGLLKGDSPRRAFQETRPRLKPGRRQGRGAGQNLLNDKPVWPDSSMRLRQLSGVGMVAIMLCWLLASPVGFFSGVNMSEAPNRMAFVAVSGAMITVLMLALTSVWEGWEVSNRRKRLAGLITGSLLGLVVAVLGAWLGVDERPHQMSQALPGVFESAGSAVAEGTTLHYALLIGLTLAVPRWWRLTERDRRSRWSIVRVFLWWLWSIAFVPALGAMTLEPQIQISMALVMLPGFVVSVVSPWDKKLASYNRRISA